MRHGKLPFYVWTLRGDHMILVWGEVPAFQPQTSEDPPTVVGALVTHHVFLTQRPHNLCMAAKRVKGCILAESVAIALSLPPLVHTFFRQLTTLEAGLLAPSSNTTSSTSCTDDEERGLLAPSSNTTSSTSCADDEERSRAFPHGFTIAFGTCCLAIWGLCAWTCPYISFGGYCLCTWPPPMD